MGRTKKKDLASSEADKFYQTSENEMSKLFLNFTEQTDQESAAHPASTNKPFNQSKLYQKRGDHTVFEDMVMDDQVNVSLQLKKDLVIGAGWEVQSEKEGTEEIRDDIEQKLQEEVESPFGDQIEELLSSYEFGFALGEPIFKRINDNEVAFHALKVRHPDTWLIHTDEKGRPTFYEQFGAQGKSIKVLPRQLIHYINKPRFQNPYGTSDLEACYAAWFAKQHVVRYYAIFLEKSASPTPVAKYDKNAPTSAVTKIFNVIKRLQNKTAMAIPKDIEVEFLEAKSNGEAYRKALDIFNMFIGRSLMMPDLLGFQGGETSGGSMALGKEHFKLYFRHIGRRRQTLEWVINKRIVRPMVQANFGNVEFFPKWKLKPITDEDILKAAELWIKATSGLNNIYKPSREEIDHFREIVKFPQGEIEDADPAQNQPPIQGQVPSGLPGANPPAEPPVEPGGPDLEIDPNAQKQEFQFKQVAGDFHKKVNFQAIENQLDARLSSIMETTRALREEQVRDLIGQIEKKRILETGNASRLDELKLKKLSGLRRSLKDSQLGLYDDAQKQAAGEVSKKSFAAPVLDQKFLDVLEAENFQYVADYEFAITKAARSQILAAIRDGRPLSSVSGVLASDLTKLSQTSLERYARTKFTEVMNRGRLSTFNATGVVTGYQYSAILDGRVTPICRGLHGKKFKAGTQPVPPLHFACRSVLIPITQFEEFKEDTRVGSTPINEFIDKNKGAGFSTQ